MRALPPPSPPHYTLSENYYIVKSGILTTYRHFWKGKKLEYREFLKKKFKNYFRSIGKVIRLSLALTIYTTTSTISSGSCKLYSISALTFFKKQLDTQFFFISVFIDKVRHIWFTTSLKQIYRCTAELPFRFYLLLSRTKTAYYRY